MKKTILLFLISFLLLPLFAHEFWLDPERFYYKPGALITVKFKVGEDFAGENWNGNRDRVQSLRLYNGNGYTQMDPVVSTEKGAAVQFSVGEEGTAVLAFESTPAFIKLEAGKFNEYLKEEGLTSALEWRRQNHQLDSPGIEHYRRSVKTLLKIGNGKSSTYSTPTSLPVDIVFHNNPFLHSGETRVQGTVFFKGNILANQPLYLWHRYKNKYIRSIQYTNAKGFFNFRIKSYGKWMISTVVMDRALPNSGADWDSYWGSCTWGYY